MSACIEWTEGKTKSGYGQVWYESKNQLAHRVVYKIVYGVIPDGLVICHKCNNKSCINPEHLVAATQRENHIHSILSGTEVKDQRFGRKQTSGKSLPKGITLSKRGIYNYYCNIRCKDRRYQKRCITLEDAIIWRNTMEQLLWTKGPKED